MRSRYSTLPGGAFVFRLVRRGGGHLPEGHVLPKREWLEPDDEDKREAVVSKREPGLSVWDRDLTTTTQAWAHRGVAPPTSEHQAFGAPVETVVAVAAGHERLVDVVADPIQPPVLAGWEGHSLVEGLARPQGTPKLRHRDFLDDLVLKMEPTK